MSERGYGQFCPVAKACEVVAERWTPLVLRELMCGSHRFSELHRGVRSMSRTLLAKRLRELEDAGIVRSHERENQHGREYHLTTAGEELRGVINLLGEWGMRWAQREIAKEDLDAELLMVDVQRRIELDALPKGKTVVRFDFSGLPKGLSRPREWWLVLERKEVDLCHRAPGLPVDVTVTSDLRAFAEVWMGHQSLTQAIRGGQLELEGPRPLVKAFPEWLKLSPFAGVEAQTEPALRSAP